MFTVTGVNRKPICVPPAALAVPLIESVTLPGAIASNRTAASKPVPDAPVASDERTSVMSIRFPFTCWVNVTLVPPMRMKLPSWTVRTRSLVGSKISVRVIVEIRDTSVIESGIVYGPPPTRNVVLGGEMITCACPTPGEVVGTTGSAVGGGGVPGGAVGAAVVAGVAAAGGVPGGAGSAVTGGGAGGTGAAGSGVAGGVVAGAAAGGG
jgi:hypothetical protein